MNRKPNAWIQKELNKAKESLDEGIHLYENGFESGGPIVRVYFGLFHAARTAVGMSKPSISGQHKNTKVELSKFVVTDNDIPFSYNDLQLYERLKKKRCEVEYENPNPNVTINMSKVIDKIENIINKLEEYAKNYLFNN